MKQTIDALQSKVALQKNIKSMEESKKQNVRSDLMGALNKMIDDGNPPHYIVTNDELIIQSTYRNSIEEEMLAKQKSREDKSKHHWFGNRKIERSTVPPTPSSYIQKKDSIKEIMTRVGFRNAFEFMLHFFDDLNWMIPGDIKNDASTVTETKCRLIYEFKTKMINYKKYYAINTDEEIWVIIENKFHGQYWSLLKKLNRRKDGK